MRAIWATDEVQDLKDGVKDKAGPAADKREERRRRPAYKAMKDGRGLGLGQLAPARSRRAP